MVSPSGWEKKAEYAIQMAMLLAPLRSRIVDVVVVVVAVVGADADVLVVGIRWRTLDGSE